MPLLWLSLAFLIGIVLASLLSLHWVIWTLLALVFLGLAFLEKRLAHRVCPVLPAWLIGFRRFSRVALGLLLAALFAGAARYQAHQPDFSVHDLAYYNGTRVELLGQVDAPPDVRDGFVLLRMLALEVSTAAEENPQAVQGFVLVRLPAGKDWRYGDRVELDGKLTTPSENEEFSYRAYLAIRGIHSSMYYPYSRRVERSAGSRLLGAIYGLRERAYQTIEKIYPQPEAGLLSGILLGIESDIPADLERSFRDTGTTHIIAISGFNIAILSGLFFGLASRVVPRLWAPVVAILAIAAYTVLVGAQASVVRAAIMGGMSMLGRQIGRRGAGANSLALTAALMCVFNPLLPWDVGFQLSFMATLGLVLYAEPLQSRFEEWVSRRFSAEFAHRLAGTVSEYLLFTLAAQVTTLPVIVYHFGRFSLSSFLANVLILPPQPLVMILGGISLLGGLAWLPLGRLLAWIAWPLPAYTNQMVRWLAEMPGGAFTLGEVPLAAVLAFYLLLFGVTLGSRLIKGRDAVQRMLVRVQPVVLLTALALVSAGVWRGVETAPDGRLHLSLLNVPAGPALLIQTPQGQAMLVDGGSSASRLSSELGARLPFTRRRLDGLLVTARKSTALEALPLTVERFPAELVLWNADAAALRNGERLAEVLGRREVTPQWLVSGQVLPLGAGVELSVLLHNFMGTALLVEWERFSMLLPGGVPAETLQRAFGNDLAGVDVIVLGEADLQGSVPAEWEAYRPAVFVWQGAGGALIPQDARWLHLDEYRWAAFETDGERLWASVGK